MRVRECELIDRIYKALGGFRASHQVHLGMGDDAALFRPRAGHELILTCDWFLEGTHFLRDKHPADSVGWKCLARALSDIAAMGGTPRCFLLSLALPGSHTGRWMDGFLAGLRRASRKFVCVLAGGDTTRRDNILINVTVVGEIRTGRAIRRSGAKDGDLIYVSGRLGEAALGLAILKSGKRTVSSRDPRFQKHLYPEPRLALGQWLAEKRLATSMIDISDGLSTDLRHLCPAPYLGALLDHDGFPALKVPASLRTRIGDPLDLALHGGDDYELLFTARRWKLPSLPWKFRGLTISPIGYVTSGPNLVWMDPKNPRILHPGGWDPFRNE
ncbi:MAG TPA: thiamine-phosphate kinase [Candidatus Acidoferrum sp.]|nr:thiamine-phosphate kinase [Candidatus Acidoferrum sp.]